MNKYLSKNTNFGLLHLITLLGAATVLILAIAHSATADYELPPRESPETTTPITTFDTPALSVGGRIYLRVHFAQDWPWDQLHWQEDLWHVVEWYDHTGTWYPVDGWHGNLDTIQQEGDGWVGQKELWAAKDDLGTGPFRWKVYQGEGGPVLATSPEFYLPIESGKTVSVDLELAP